MAISSPQISMPKGGGAIKGIGETFQPNSFSGTASLSIPIYTSPCRGSEPTLGVQYNSGTGNSIFGLGFDLSIPNIARKTSKGIPQYDTSDTFILSNAEDLVVVSGGRRNATLDNLDYIVVAYRPRVEGLFAKIERWIEQASGESHWRVVSKENVVSIYGKTAQARIADPENSDHVFQWLLQESFDAKGQHVVYEYKPENTDNVPQALYELNRSQVANTYITRIKYGHDRPIVESQDIEQTQWHFEVLFDYGEYNIDLSNPAPCTVVAQWSQRADPFSTYHAGFEIRTHRLCRTILMVHRFVELGSEPILVHATRFHYDETPSMTLLKAVESIGFRDENGQYTTKSLPPLEFDYTPFQPQGHAFAPFIAEDGRSLPGLVAANYMLIDLYGEGIPGVLYSDSSTVLYWEPQGGANGGENDRTARYGLPQEPISFPIDRDLGAPGRQLIDLTGNGQLDLVVSTAAGAGYYEANPDRSWRNFRLFPAVPTDFQNPNHQLLDVTGDGLIDLLLIADEYVVVYPGRGKDGFGAPLQRAREHRLPWPEQGTATEAVRFADMFGTGSQQLVRITNGRVECWPHLGYGRFGKPVRMEHAPHFGADMDAARLFLADIDGSGTADLLYIDTDRVQIWFNQSGNAFCEEPLTIQLPSQWDSLGQIRFADVFGNGTTCLIFSELHPQPRHWCYDFCQGHKPYLLNAIANNLGATSSITYAGSTKFYLADKRNGRPWITNLPFPVQLIEQIESVDLISDTRLVSTYSYHHGYYDGVEREFRGFGMVERRDAETLGVQSLPTDVPPVLTKTWYHTGAFVEAGVFSRQYAAEYYQADPQAHLLPDTVFDTPLAQSDADTLREGYRALHGAVLREEVYSLDAQRHPQLAEHPYSVTETNFLVRLVLPRAGQKYAVLLVDPRETIAYHYERNPADPRIEHTLTIEVDDYGHVLKACHLAYPRRDIQGAYPEQQRLRATAAVGSVINVDPARDAGVDFYLLGLPREERSFEIGGLDAPQGYFSFEQIERHLDAAFAHQIPFEQAFAEATPQARLLSWQRHYYWNAEQSAPLALGEVTARALLHHSEAAIFSPDLIRQVFGDKLPDALLHSQGGYLLQDGYWWNPGLIECYYDAARYYLPWKTIDPFGAETVVTYDAHLLLPQTVTDALGNVTRVERFDYHTLQPQKLIDINDNSSEARFDPLGSVIATSIYGTQGDRATGDAPLEQYALRPEAQLATILQNPEQYLQQATSYFFYDLFAWKNDRQPPYALSLMRETHAGDLAPGAATRVRVGIAYSDGFGRAVQTKLKAEPGQALLRDVDGNLRRDAGGRLVEGAAEQRWLTSGRTVYNNKGKPVKQYEPFYSATARYESEREVTEYGVTPILHYDPLLRVVRVDTPKGFFSKVEFSPWAEKHYDENDTIKDSIYYTQFLATYPAVPTEAQKNEKDALDKASAFYNTPQISVLDSAGNPFLAIQNNLGGLPEDTFKDIVGGSATSAAVWQMLLAQRYLMPEQQDSPYARVAESFQPYRSGFKASFIAGLPDTFKQFGEALLDHLKQSCLTAYHKYDIQGRAIESIDPRLYYVNITQGTAYYNFRYRYAMVGTTPLATDSADAGLNMSLSNVLGSFLWNRSARNFDQVIDYDRLQRMVSIRIKGIKNDGTVATDTIVETFVYGEGQPQAKNLNLRGQLYQHQDQSGTIVNSRYSLQGALLETRRQFTLDYKDYINWDKAVSLDSERYTSQFAFNALGQVISETTPDGSVTINSYNQAGALDRVAVRFKDGTSQPIIDQIDYNARGQRISIAYANGVSTAYTYETTTARLVRLYSTRSGRDAQGQQRQTVLQDITYTYDPVGNITRTYDQTYQTVFHNNQKVEPLSDYTYDALYRLIKARGRQHPGINATTERNNQNEGSFKQSRLIALPNDSTKLENYYEDYTYDEAGSLVKTTHVAANRWTRRLEIMPDSNRIKTVDGQDVAYDRSGNQTQLYLNSAVGLTWSCCETLRKAGIIARPGEQDDSDYYTYDRNELRTRKISERMANGGAVIQKEEKRYLGDYEVKIVQNVTQNNQTTILRRQTLRVMDDRTCVAIIHYWEQDDLKREADKAGTRSLRYQLGDHLGSAALELAADAEIISYEEYFPYGGTALIAGRSQREVQQKEYRYSGKERDDTTGLYYYGARYYAAWLGRWLSADPAGTVDGPNLYAFVGGNPVGHVDQEGLMERETTEEKRSTRKRRVSYNEDDVFADILGEEFEKEAQYTEQEEGKLEEKRKEVTKRQKANLDKSTKEQKKDPRQDAVREVGASILSGWPKSPSDPSDKTTITRGKDWSEYAAKVTAMKSHEAFGTRYIKITGYEFGIGKVQQSTPPEKINLSHKSAQAYVDLVAKIEGSEVKEKVIASAVRRVLKGTVISRGLPEAVAKNEDLVKTVYSFGTLLATSEYFRSVSGPVIAILGLSYIKNSGGSFDKVFGKQALWIGTGVYSAESLRSFQAGLNFDDVGTLAAAFEEHVKGKGTLKAALQRKIARHF